MTFNLLGEVAGNKRIRPDTATTVQTVTTQKTYNFSFSGVLATTDDTLREINREIKPVTTCRHLAPELKQPENQCIQLLSPLSSMSPPIRESFGFLKETPFTKEMIIYGLKHWQQPFNQSDMNEIASGELTIEQAIRYLFFWARQNQSGYLKLKELTRNRNIPN